MGNVVAIVNSFNRLDLLQVGLPSLIEALKALSRPASVVVFDAGSTDGSREYLANFAKSSPVPIHGIHPPVGDDTSFSAGINAACSYALEKYPDLDYYFFFETDNFISSPEPLRKALELIEGVKYLAGVGFTVYKHSGEEQGFGCSFPTIGQLILGQQLTCILKLDSPPRHWQGFDTASGSVRFMLCDVVFTSPLLVRQEAWAKSQLDAIEFPFSDCDVDWCWRLKDQGWRMAVLEAKGVIHDNKQALSAWSGERALHFHRARLKLLRRHVGVKGKFVKPLLFARHCLEATLLFAMRACGKVEVQDKLLLRKRMVKSVFNDYRE